MDAGIYRPYGWSELPNIMIIVVEWPIYYLVPPSVLLVVGIPTPDVHSWLLPARFVYTLTMFSAFYLRSGDVTRAPLKSSQQCFLEVLQSGGDTCQNTKGLKATIRI